MPDGRALPFPITWESKSKNRKESDKIELSDERIIAQLTTGEGDALGVLFDRYSRLVLHIAHQVLRDRGEAEEIVQDVFLYVYRKSCLFDPGKGIVKAWIVQIAYHRALDRRAYLARRGFYLGTEIEPLDDTLVGTTDLDREIGAKLDRAQLEKAFSELPANQRQTLELYYFEGMELREISEKLGEPLGNVRHHFYRGLDRLRKSAFVRTLREK